VQIVRMTCFRITQGGVTGEAADRDEGL